MYMIWPGDVSDPAITKTELKKDWILTEISFRQLLNWLDEGVDSGGERYLDIRLRLVIYFDRKGCPSPDELADETLNRVARRLEEEGVIITDAPAHYCYIVARFVLLESLRKQPLETPLDYRLSVHPTTDHPLTGANEKQNERERCLECLERCIASLDPDNRELIVSYYRGERRPKIENRKGIAAKLGVSLNAVSIRACRIRDKLETCMRECLSSA